MASRSMNFNGSWSDPRLGQWGSPFEQKPTWSVGTPNDQSISDWAAARAWPAFGAAGLVPAGHAQFLVSEALAQGCTDFVLIGLQDVHPGCAQAVVYSRPRSKDALKSILIGARGYIDTLSDAPN